MCCRLAVHFENHLVRLALDQLRIDASPSPTIPLEPRFPLGHITDPAINEPHQAVRISDICKRAILESGVVIPEMIFHRSWGFYGAAFGMFWWWRYIIGRFWKCDGVLSSRSKSIGDRLPFFALSALRRHAAIVECSNSLVVAH